MVVARQAAEVLSVFELALNASYLAPRIDDCVAEPLVIAFFVIMNQVRSCGSTQRLLAEEDHSEQAFFLDTPHEPLDVRRQIRRPRRQTDPVDAFLFQDVAKRSREFRVAIHEQISRAEQESVKRIGQVLGHLLHPPFVRIGCTSSDMHASRGNLHDEEKVIRDQATFRPDFHCREVDRGQNVPEGLDEGLPGGLPFPIIGRFNAVFFQDIADRLVGDAVSYVGQRALDTIVSPGRLFASESQDQVNNDLAESVLDQRDIVSRLLVFLFRDI